MRGAGEEFSTEYGLARVSYTPRYRARPPTRVGGPTGY